MVVRRPPVANGMIRGKESRESVIEKEEWNFFTFLGYPHENYFCLVSKAKLKRRMKRTTKIEFGKDNNNNNKRRKYFARQICQRLISIL